MRRWRLLLKRLSLPLAALLVLLAGAAPAHADTPIALWKAFDGRVNFTGTQVTLRTRSNSSSWDSNWDSGGACTVTAPGTNRTASLSLPLGATVLSAQLYWAGSGIPDSTVTFERQDVTASRKYSSTTVGGGFNYFGGAADVTAIVKAKGSGTYNFSGLSVSNGRPWCAAQGVLGGFSLLVVYAHPTQPERVLNLYEGFRYVQNGEVIVNANNFRWNRTAIPVKEKARIGHISWEGDPTLAQDGERLRFEGTEVTDSLNPEGNQFNSRSNINNDSASYGIDFDAYDTSVTIWSGYDATVTTAYRTGQDMVILNAEILVVPTMPVSDLSIALTRLGALKVGSETQYTVKVMNNGPYTEAGPITVSNTLPSGMTYVSAGGTGWTCTGSANSGSCVYRGALAPGASAPLLNLTVAVSSGGEKVNTVTVKGTDDDNLANNSASDTGTAPIPPSTPTPPSAGTPKVSFVFTDKKCTAGKAFGTADQCNKYSAPTVGGRKTPIFLTVLVDGVPNNPAPTGATIALLQFRLECRNPATGGVDASYAGATLPACGDGETEKWSLSTQVNFPTSTVSLEHKLEYKDVGKVKLHLKGGDAADATEEFVSAPLRIAFSSIKNGTVPNPGHTKPGDKGFAAAGTPLTVEIGALLETEATEAPKYAPNFGKESPAPVIELTRALIGDPVKLVSEGTLTESAPPAWKDGIRTSTAAWSEVGAINFVTRLLDPNANPDTPEPDRKDDFYFGVKVLGSRVAVGRFYPSYFKTEALGRFDCPARLVAEGIACPRDGNGAVYSGQSFDVTVIPRNYANQSVKNFTGAWFKEITLHAVGEAGEDVLATNFTPPTGATSTTIASVTTVKDAEGEGSTDRILGRAAYRLADGYSSDKHRATTITRPTTIYVRAVSPDGTAQGDPVITSQRVGEASDEAGIMVVNGRLVVPNALGNDLLRTPLGLRAEYWGGDKLGWQFNPGYADTIGVPGTGVVLVDCSRDFQNAEKKCDTAVAGAVASQTVKMAKGKGVLWLRAPGKRDQGAARTGFFTLRFGAWAWLPSTVGRVSFGSHRSPVIYVREMYF